MRGEPSPLMDSTCRPGRLLTGVLRRFIKRQRAVAQQGGGDGDLTGSSVPVPELDLGLQPGETIRLVLNSKKVGMLACAFVLWTVQADVHVPGSQAS